jgi:hypothetical protein
MAEVSMMWVGNPLTEVQRLCMRSFLHHGHDVTLYAYEELDPPAGVTVADANTIVSDKDIFESHQTFAAFADVFRYKLLFDKQAFWVDADTLCLRPDWDFGDYIFGLQELGKVNNSVLGYPRDSSLAHLMKSRSIYQQTNVFDALGPILLTSVLDELEMTHLAQPTQVFSPIAWSEFSVMWEPEALAYVLDTCEESHAVSLWNYMLGFHQYPRDAFPEGSAMAYWNKRFSE